MILHQHYEYKLINKLINTHNVDEESSINNEIRNVTKFLSSLLNIKKNEINQNNNINNNMNLGMMNYDLMQQQMMLQQQMMAAQALQAQQAEMNNLNFQNMNNFPPINNQAIPQKSEHWNLTFKYPYHPTINICIDSNKLFGEAINMFKTKSGLKEDLIYLHNAKKLSKDIIISQSGLSHGSVIQVHPKQQVIAGKLN